jgi:hypothetical protein
MMFPAAAEADGKRRCGQRRAARLSSFPSSLLCLFPKSKTANIQRHTANDFASSVSVNACIAVVAGCL